MRKMLSLLAALCLLAPCAAAEEELSISDLIDAGSGVVTGLETEQEAGEALEEVPAETPEEEDGTRLITATFAGDFTIGGDSRKRTNIFEDELKKQDGDINFTMRNVRDILMEDDLTLINFEGTLTNSTHVPDNKRENQFLFSAPPEYVSILTDNGVEAVALENNHVMDHGEEVYQETQQTLTDAGIVWSNAETVGEIMVKGVKIGMLSYQTFDRYDTLFTQVPLDVAEAKARYDLVIVSFHWGNEKDYAPNKNQQKMGKLAIDAGADLVVGHHSHRINPIDLVIVSFHWGNEKDYAPNKNQQKMGKLAIDAGADLVVGHHSHRINPIEEYKGKYIVYSLGNFCFAGNSKPSDMSSFLFQMRWRVHENTITQEGWRIIPIRISSRSDYNDFAPTVLEKATAIDGLLTTLKENGKKLENPVAEYPLTW